MNNRRSFYVTALEENPALQAGIALLQKYPPAHFDQRKSIDDAEIVLYLEHGYIGLAELPRLLSRVRSAPSAMHFAFSESDWPFPVLPGAYPSLVRRYPWAEGWCYLPIGENEAARAETVFLYSFLGRVSTHSVRKHILSLDTEATPCVSLENASTRFSDFDYSSTYKRLISESKFVLCPRGFGASSIRIFETMGSGRVPVIISDRWQPPPGIFWSDFSVKVPEAEVASIPGLLRRMEGSAPTMGRLAKQAFDEYFSPNVFFDRLLAVLTDRFSNCSFAPTAIYERTLRSFGAREIRTLCHQARSSTLNFLSVRQ